MYRFLFIGISMLILFVFVFPIETCTTYTEMPNIEIEKPLTAGKVIYCTKEPIISFHINWPNWRF